MVVENGEDYSSTSSDDDDDGDVTQPPPAPVKKTKTNRKISAKPKKIHYPAVKKKKNKKPEPVEVAEGSEPFTDVEDCDPPESIDQPMEEQKKQRKRKKPETILVPTSDPNIVVQMKRRKPGPRLQNVVVYEEDLPQPKIRIIQKSHKKGRPRTKQDVVVEKDEGAHIHEDKVVIDRPAENKKPLNARQLKRMELDQKFVEMEAIAGRKLRQNKNGQIDKRSIKERSPAQIAAARRLAEYNKELRKKKAEEKSKQAVKEVITELAVAKEMRDKDRKKKNREEEEKKVDEFVPKPFSVFGD